MICGVPNTFSFKHTSASYIYNFLSTCMSVLPGLCTKIEFRNCPIICSVFKMLSGSGWMGSAKSFQQRIIKNAKIIR